MKVSTDKLMRPSPEELKLLKRLDEAYQFGEGSEFEALVRAALQDDLRKGLITPRKDGEATALEVEEREDGGLHLKGSFYLLKDNELPSPERCDVFRRLCHRSPSMPVDVELPNGQLANGQLVEQNDLQRLLRCLLAALKKLFGFGDDTPEKGRQRDLSDGLDL